jgi:hypothetical protein
MFAALSNLNSTGDSGSGHRPATAAAKGAPSFLKAAAATQSQQQNNGSGGARVPCSPNGTTRPTHATPRLMCVCTLRCRAPSLKRLHIAVIWVPFNSQQKAKSQKTAVKKLTRVYDDIPPPVRRRRRWCREEEKEQEEERRRQRRRRAGSRAPSAVRPEATPPHPTCRNQEVHCTPLGTLAKKHCPSPRHQGHYYFVVAWRAFGAG